MVKKILSRPKLLPKLAWMLGLVLVIIVAGTAIDFVVHSLSEKFAVPEYYFKDKIIFGTLWGFVAVLVFQRVHNLNLKAVLMSATVAVLLQIRYFLTGYALWFVILFLFLHFIMFLVPALIIFKKYPEVFW
jgi:hypothetical protein